MTIADYFKVSFKKPELSETISQIIEKKAKLKKSIGILLFEARVY
jgi:hypothetical protein